MNWRNRRWRMHAESVELVSRDDTGQRLTLSLTITGLRLAPLEGKHESGMRTFRLGVRHCRARPSQPAPAVLPATEGNLQRGQPELSPDSETASEKSGKGA